jgi:diacylglycerol kinase family enzyme
MRVAVFYNDDAGGSPAAADIRSAIEKHGHHVVNVVEKGDGVERLFELASDLIVAAGGDGTVASVAREVAGHNVPLAVLPLGTANNIALSLGWSGTIDELIDYWPRAFRRRADLGIARGPWGERYFVEGVGGGLVTRTIAVMDAQPLDSSHAPEHRLELAMGGYLTVLAQMKPEPWSMQLDGERLNGEFLLVEVLNMQSIGPNFVISEATDPFDSALTVALAFEEDREQLVAYWQARMAGEPAHLQLQTRTATNVVLAAGGDLHVDDRLFAWPETGAVDLSVAPGVLQVLTGPAAGLGMPASAASADRVSPR